MKYWELISSWNISQTTTCACWCIEAPNDLVIHPGITYEINLPFDGEAPSALLKVNHHMGNKPWRVISEFLYFNEKRRCLTIPVITNDMRTLKKGETICHVEVKDPVHTLQNIQGNCIIVIKKTITKFFCTLLLLFYLF